MLKHDQGKSIDITYLEECRSMSDPLADDAVKDIITSGDERKVNQLMGQLFANNSFSEGMFDHLGADIAKTIDTYLTSTSALPSWADPNLIKTGEQVFAKYGPEVFMLLNVSSLPLCYTCAKGAKVLFETGRLLTHNGDIDPLARRLMETAQMVVNVLAEGGLSPSGSGVVTLQKVRLIHASIRFFLKQKGWDSEEYGEPINQEDLAGTLMSFGPVILSGLAKLGVQLSKEEQNAYMHCWKVVGYLMGVNDKLLVDTFSEGFDLATAILAHQAAPSEEGKALTASCIDFVNYLIPGDSMDNVPPYFMQFFLQEYSDSSKVDLSACVGLDGKEAHKEKMVLKLTRFLVEKLSHLEDHKFVEKIASYFNKKLLEGIIGHFNHGKNVHFYIPPSLTKDWNITSSN